MQQHNTALIQASKFSARGLLFLLSLACCCSSSALLCLNLNLNSHKEKRAPCCVCEPQPARGVTVGWSFCLRVLFRAHVLLSFSEAAAAGCGLGLGQTLNFHSHLLLPQSRRVLSAPSAGWLAAWLGVRPRLFPSRCRRS